MNGTELLLGPLAGGMALATAVLLQWASEAKTSLAAAVVAFLLAMMVAMFVGALLYVRAPTTSTLVLGLWVAASLMAVSVFPVITEFVADVRARLRAGPTGYEAVPLRRPRAFVALVVGLVLGNELLMGATFQLASGTPLGPSGQPVTLLVGIVDSPWFLLTMATEMAATAYLLRARLGPALTALLGGQAALMALSPVAFGDPRWVAVTIDLGSAAMIGLFVLLMEHLYRHRQPTTGFSDYLLGLLAVYATMMAGLYLWVVGDGASVFALSVVLEMVLVFGAVIRPERLRGTPGPPWTLRPAWTFGLLSTIFVAELFMGALLDARLEPAALAAGPVDLALSGPVGTVLANALSNGFWFVADVTASVWFLAMMGVEMGALVVFKLRETRHLENRIRLALMLGSYGAFAVFYPSVYFSLVAPNAPPPSQVPVLGWSMGLGSYPVAAGVFGAILLTYLITGALVVLFGRRVVCSTFCTAALMYQGTTIDAMKSFNRSSPLGRKYLSSRISGVYAATSGVTLAGLAIASSVSYLDSVGRLNVSVGGTDPAVFLFALSFSVLWYAMFVSIPFAGSYNCVTMGWCYTGAIAQAFHRVGFFKLKVRSREVCRACTTLDCARGCPVGLVDMVGHFRQSGEFRSSKCCGVGDCVEACPYDNLYIADIRHWLRARWARPAVPSPRLPMVRAGSAPPVTGPAVPGLDAQTPR